MSQTEKKQSSSPFVSGVMLGGVLGSVGLFLLGTKSGREKLKKLIDACENIEELIAEHEKEHKHKKDHDNPIISDVENLMGKLQSILPDSKTFK